jgi:hypothetical protein
MKTKKTMTTMMTTTMKITRDSVPTRDNLRESDCGGDDVLPPALKELAELVEIQNPDNSMAFSKEQWEYVEARV